MDLINMRFMFYAFSAAWIIMITYVVILVRRGQRIEKELGRLKTQLDDRGQG